MRASGLTTETSEMRGGLDVMNACETAGVNVIVPSPDF
jgi:hypothetical protein